MSSYCGLPPLPEDMLRWNLDPVLILGLLGCAVLAMRSARPRSAMAGIAVLALAFVSPLCAISVALFSARAIHHILIVAVAALLIAHAFPARRPAHVGLGLALSTVTLWLWHLPGPYDRALADTLTYWAMQASLLGTSLWFWRSLFAAPPVSASFAAIGAMAQMGMLGALLTFAPDALYMAHAGTTLPWGMTQLEDQQLAGLLMWVLGTVPYALAIALVARRIWAQAAASA